MIDPQAEEFRKEGEYLDQVQTAIDRTMKDLKDLTGEGGKPRYVPLEGFLALQTVLIDVLAIAREYHDGAADLVG